MSSRSRVLSPALAPGADPRLGLLRCGGGVRFVRCSVVSSCLPGLSGSGAKLDGLTLIVRWSAASRPDCSKAECGVEVKRAPSGVAPQGPGRRPDLDRSGARRYTTPTARTVLLRIGAGGLDLPSAGSATWLAATLRASLGRNGYGAQRVCRASCRCVRRHRPS